MESHCLVDATNFKDIKNHFNHSWIYLHFLVHCNVYYLAQIYSNITSYEIKKSSFFGIWLFGFLPTLICKNIVKILHNNHIVEVQTWDLWKKKKCDNNLGPLVMCFHRCIEVINIKWPLHTLFYYYVLALMLMKWHVVIVVPLVIGL